MKKQFFKKVIPIAVLSTVLVASLVSTIANPSVQANEARTKTTMLKSKM